MGHHLEASSEDSDASADVIGVILYWILYSWWRAKEKKGQRAKSKGQKAEGKGQRAEGRGKKEKGKR